MQNKKGFISTALVYSFLVIYLFLMVSIINMYLTKTTYLEGLDEQVAKDIGIIKSERETLLEEILADKGNVASEINLINFKDISHSSYKNGNGLFYIDESKLPQNDSKYTDVNNDGYGKKIYFFRGTVTNNFVIFGKVFQRKADGKIDFDTMHDMCWRVLRTNENGSIRLIYSGVAEGGKCLESDVTINSYVSSVDGVPLDGKYNVDSNDNAYVGYTYAGANENNYPDTHYTSQTDSAVKKAVDEFFIKYTDFYYSSELNYEKTGPDDLIQLRHNSLSDSIYCNDRSVSCPDIATLVDDAKNNCGFGTVKTNYGYTLEEMATYICNGPYDKYSLANHLAGGIDNETNLLYAIGLPTASEVVMAGGSIEKNNTGYFLKSNKAYWTMTPASFDGSVAKVYVVDVNGKLVPTNVDSTGIGIRPVISIKDNTIVNSGSGLRNIPYNLND